MEEEKPVPEGNEPAPKKDDENIVYQEVREERFHRLKKSATDEKGFLYYLLASILLVVVISITFGLSVFLGKQFVQAFHLKKNPSAAIPETIPAVEDKFKTASAPEITLEAKKAIAPVTNESFAKNKKGLKITTIPASSEAAKTKISPAIKKAEASPVKASPKKVAPTKALNAGSGYYKVQAGLFRAKANAKSLINNLKQQGFSTYLRLQKDGMYRVQVGAFRTEKEAKDLAQKLKSKYFESAVIYE